MPFDVALSGLNSAMSKAKTAANNVANVSTVGFKSSRVNTVDVGSQQPGSGVRVAQIQNNYAQGIPEFTEQSFDIAISGQGFFQVSENGSRFYSRNGSFTLDRNGYVTNSRGQRLIGYSADTNGNITSQQTELRVGLNSGPPIATSKIGLNVNLDARQNPPVSAFSPNDPTSYNFSTRVTVNDSLGSSHQVDFYYRKSATTATWDVSAYADGNAVMAPTSVQFDGNGALSSPASGTLTIPAFNPGNGASTMNISVDASKLTQYGVDSNVNATTQNGQTSSAISGFAVNANGVISARYDNGKTATIGQVSLTQFPNPNGLAPNGNGNFLVSSAAGDPVTGTPGSGGLGLLQAGALESSNVNLDEQLINLKLSQYEYEANAKVIKTTDEMIGTLLKDRA